MTSTTARLVLAGAGVLLAGCTSPGSDATGPPEPTRAASAAPATGAAESTAPAELDRPLAVQQGARIVVLGVGDAAPETAAPSAPEGQEAADWSPDGGRIAFEVDHTSIWVAELGGGARQVFACDDPCVQAQHPAWSRDGGRLAFMVVESKDGSTTSRAAIVVLSLATGEVRTVHEDTSGRVWLFSPRWSPDGSRLVFEADTYASDRLDESRITTYAVGSVGVDGGAVSRLESWTDVLPGPGSPSPDWSGAGIVYVRNDNLVLSRDASSPGTGLTDLDPASEHAIQPTFAPDGDHVVFTHVRGTFDVDDVPQVATLGLDDGTIVDLGVFATHARWQP